MKEKAHSELQGEVLKLLGIWRGASFACDSANALDEPAKDHPGLGVRGDAHMGEMATNR